MSACDFFPNAVSINYLITSYIAYSLFSLLEPHALAVSAILCPLLGLGRRAFLFKYIEPNSPYKA